MKSKFFFLIVAWAVLLLLAGPLAEASVYHSKEAGFSITWPDGWAQRNPEHQGVLVSFASAETGEFANISVRDLPQGKTLDELRWDELFSPHFDLIQVKNQGSTVLTSGVRTRYCLYAIRESPLKKQLEGKLNLLYLNYVIVWQGRLYSVTFTDTQEAFLLHYPQFTKAMLSLTFDQ